MRFLGLFLITVWLTGCSMFGKSSVETLEYQTIQSDEAQNIEVRRYDRIVRISAPLDINGEEDRSSAFRSLFKYISGNNIDSTNIEMTAPVFMDQSNENEGQTIAMTAPVLMQTAEENPTMSFVLPASYNLENAPQPKDSRLRLSELTNYTVAVITFNGRLEQDNINTHETLLREWIGKKGYQITGAALSAGYNPPFTIPAFRRNEVFIPIQW